MEKTKQIELFKTFTVWSQTDNTWTGGGITVNKKCDEQLDALINDYANKNKLKICKVDYSSVHENTQHGSYSGNTTRCIFIMAGVSFRRKYLGLF